MLLLEGAAPASRVCPITAEAMLKVQPFCEGLHHVYLVAPSVSGEVFASEGCLCLVQAAKGREGYDIYTSRAALEHTVRGH